MGEKIAKEFNDAVPAYPGLVTAMALDLADLESVRAFAKKFGAERDKLHVLINNAGIMHTPEGKTKQGFELQFGTNHLGHFLLTELLIDKLAAAKPSRVVILSSSYHDVAPHFGLVRNKAEIDFDDLMFEVRGRERCGWRWRWRWRLH